MDAFDKALGKSVTALAYVACAVIPCLFTMIVIDVSIRMMGYNPPLFTSSVVEYALLYIAMFAAPWLVREKGHVSIEAVITQLPAPMQRFLAKFVYLVCMLASILFSYFSWQLLLDAWESGQIDMRGVDMPYWAQFLPMFIGFVFISLEFLMYLIGRRHYYSYDLGDVKDGV
jgi:TRAP-type C4-dicarboxylate transport system permease small subunit